MALHINHNSARTENISVNWSWWGTQKRQVKRKKGKRKCPVKGERVGGNLLIESSDGIN